MDFPLASACVAAIREAVALVHKTAFVRRRLSRAPNCPAEVSLLGHRAISEGAAQSTPERSGGDIARQRALRPASFPSSYKRQQARFESGPGVFRARSALPGTSLRSVSRLELARARAIPLLVCSAYVVCFVPYGTPCPYAGHRVPYRTPPSSRTVSLVWITMRGSFHSVAAQSPAGVTDVVR
jgi:hypothetical protein